jgi:adenylyltransferase/sulfurtransferase
MSDDPLDITLEDDGGGEAPERARVSMPQAPAGRVDVDLEEDRYHRLRLIPWWDQERLRGARVMVVGAGAIGNEIIKSLTLLGVGRIFIADLDRIEDSNLSRSVLFRHKDQGRYKAEVAADAVRDLNPDVQAQSFVGNVVYDLGLGVYRDMDVVFGALDNREARVAINAACWKLNKPWIDGAIEVMQGFARVFVPPDGPCYECTMSELDYKLLSVRRSCALLKREDILEGKVPTTPTTASVIAGIQVQEAIKYLHRDRNLPILAGKGFVFNGMTHDSYIVEYQRREDCPAHDTFEGVLELDQGVAGLTGREALEIARREVGPEACVEFDREICTGLTCARCNETEPLFTSLGKVSEALGRCPKCGEMRDPQLTHALYGDELYLDKTLAELGLPPYDIITGREGLTMKHWVLAKDRDAALGETA